MCMLAPPFNFLYAAITVRKLEDIVTIEALAIWFCLNAQRFLHEYQRRALLGAHYLISACRFPATGIG